MRVYCRGLTATSACAQQWKSKIELRTEVACQNIVRLTSQFHIRSIDNRINGQLRNVSFTVVNGFVRGLLVYFVNYDEIHTEAKSSRESPYRPNSAK
jgi:hypothetical protein